MRAWRLSPLPPPSLLFRGNTRRRASLRCCLVLSAATRHPASRLCVSTRLFVWRPCAFAGTGVSFSCAFGVNGWVHGWANAWWRAWGGVDSNFLLQRAETLPDRRCGRSNRRMANALLAPALFVLHGLLATSCLVPGRCDGGWRVGWGCWSLPKLKAQAAGKGGSFLRQGSPTLPFAPSPLCSTQTQPRHPFTCKLSTPSPATRTRRDKTCHGRSRKGKEKQGTWRVLWVVEACGWMAEC